MTVHELMQRVAPPRQPSETGSAAQWAAVEAAIGVALPPDYKAFITTYGSGSFDDFVVFFNPFASRPHHNLQRQLAQYQEAERIRSQSFPARTTSLVEPFALYPASGGLLPFGTTTNFGDAFFWQVGGAPEDWPVVFYNLRDGDYEVFDMTCTEFMAGVAAETVAPQHFPYTFPGEAAVTFQPYAPLAPSTADDG